MSMSVVRKGGTSVEVRQAIGLLLRASYDDLLKSPLPARHTELLEKLKGSPDDEGLAELAGLAQDQIRHG